MWISQENENSSRQKDCKQTAAAGTQEADDSLIDCSFPKSARILSKKHYHAISKTGRKLSGHAVFINCRKGRSLCSKLGITVSKRYGKAHERNRFKRLVREVFRKSRPFLPKDIEILVLPRLPAQEMSSSLLIADLSSIFQSLSHVKKS